MNADERFDGNLSVWLHQRAGQGSPAYLDDILGRTHQTRQRPAWTFIERWIPVDITTRANAFAPPRLGRALLVVALVAILLVAAVLVAGSRQQRVPPPFGPAANGAIVYSKGGDIFRAAADGSAPALVIGGVTTDVGPQYSYDGTRLAFLREVGNRTLQLMVADPDGTNARVMSDEPFIDPNWWDWSPDGRSLVVVHSVDGRSVLSIVPTDGSASRQLDIGGLDAQDATWRPPDGREILFRGQARDGRHTALYAVRADGSGLRALTPVLDDQDAYGGMRPSPGGATVTYDSPDGANWRSHVLDLATGADHLIGGDPTAVYEGNPKFSPDGSQILYIRYAVDEPSRVMIAPADGSRPGRQVGPDLTVNGDFYFEFSPDGAKVLVFDRRAASSTVVDVASGTTESGGAIDDWATWQRLALPGG